MRKKSGLSRTMIYGGTYAEKMFAMIIMIVIIYGIFFFSSGNDLISSGLQFYFAFMVAIMLFVTQIMNYSQFIPISISFGNRRKETMLGIQWMNFILVVQSIIIFGIWILFFPGKVVGMEPEVMILYIVMIVTLSGLGEIVAAAYSRFGKIGGILSAAFMFIIIIATFTTGILVDMNYENLGDVITNISLVIRIGAVLGAFSIYAIGTYLNYRVLMKYEVRG